CDSFDRPPRSPPGWPRPPAQRTPATARWWTSGRWLSPGTSWIPDRMAHAEEDLLRRLAPQVLAALVRRYGHFDTAEDAVQEACWRPPRNGPRKAFPATRVAG